MIISRKAVATLLVVWLLGVVGLWLVTIQLRLDRGPEVISVGSPGESCRQVASRLQGDHVVAVWIPTQSSAVRPTTCPVLEGFPVTLGERTVYYDFYRLSTDEAEDLARLNAGQNCYIPTFTKYLPRRWWEFKPLVPRGNLMEFGMNKGFLWGQGYNPSYRNPFIPKGYEWEFFFLAVPAAGLLIVPFFGCIFPKPKKRN